MGRGGGSCERVGSSDAKIGLPILLLPTLRRFFISQGTRVNHRDSF